MSNNDVVQEFIRKLAARIQKRVAREGECLIWTGALSNSGYGVISVFGRPIGVHRVAYQIEYGPIGEDEDVHHRCRRRLCVRPEHLLATSRLVHNNITHGVTTHCRRGHEFTPENTYVTPAGLRQCKACRSARRPERQPAADACPKGHPYDEENTYLYTDKKGYPHRLCRACRRESNRVRQLARAKKRGGAGYPGRTAD